VDYRDLISKIESPVDTGHKAFPSYGKLFITSLEFARRDATIDPGQRAELTALKPGLTAVIGASPEPWPGSSVMMPTFE
jgi:hypothetical protein